MMHVSCAKNEPKLQEEGRLFLLCICTVITKEKCNCPKGDIQCKGAHVFSFYTNHDIFMQVTLLYNLFFVLAVYAQSDISCLLST